MKTISKFVVATALGGLFIASAIAQPVIGPFVKPMITKPWGNAAPAVVGRTAYVVTRPAVVGRPFVGPKVSEDLANKAKFTCFRSGAFTLKNPKSNDSITFTRGGQPLKPGHTAAFVQGAGKIAFTVPKGKKETSYVCSCTAGPVKSCQEA